MADLKDQFTGAMVEVYRRAKDEAGYTASVFHKMLVDKGGLLTAKQLINASQPSEGYTQLFERGRLDLTVEAVVINDPKWHPLFTAEELDRARRRLRQYGYSF